jgi:hypothetical protein
MAFLLTQAGTTLYKVDVATGTATALSLPSGVTLSSTRKPKFAILNNWVAMVNSPSKNLLIDPEGTVIPLVPQAPVHAPNIDEGSGTGLDGVYFYAVSFIVKNSDGDLLAESPMSPPTQSINLSDQDVALTNIPLSPDAHVTGRRVYRTLTDQTPSSEGGTPTVFFHLFDIDDNTTEAINDNAADATVSLLPASSELVSPPGTMPGIRFKNIVQWKSRFWAVADDSSLVDTVFVCNTNKVYSWPNQVVAYPAGQTEKGIIGFAARKNSLAFLKTTGVWAITGVSSATGINFSKISVHQIDDGKKGCVAEDTILVIGDAAYWLGRNGMYEWTDEHGIISVSDETVKPWFQSDTYFNRTRFPYAFSRYNEVTNSIELHLAAAASSTEDRWVSFNLSTRKWYGPHKTGALTPTHAWHQYDASGLPMTLVGGSDGVIYAGNSANKRDGAATAIDMDCYGPWHVGDTPDRMHTWLQLSMLTNVEASGTMDITPYLGVGPKNASAGADISHTLTTGRELLRRIGHGAVMRLRMRKNTVNTSATIYGYEIPWFTNGRR